MQTLALRTLSGKLPINASITCSRLPERATLSGTYTCPASPYNIRRSVHASFEEFSDSESTMDAQNKPDAEAEVKTCHSHRDDMADSFGHAYSTRSSDEGFGERYEEVVEYETPSKGLEATAERDTDSNTQGRQGYDQTQGSEVREKEMARHATQHTAFSAHNRPTPGGVGGTAT